MSSMKEGLRVRVTNCVLLVCQPAIDCVVVSCSQTAVSTHRRGTSVKIIEKQTFNQTHLQPELAVAFTYLIDKLNLIENRNRTFNPT